MRSNHNSNNVNNNNNTNHHHYQQQYQQRYRIPSPPILSRNRENTSSKSLSLKDDKINEKKSYDNSALRLGGNVHKRFDLNMQPMKSKSNQNDVSRNPFKIDLDTLSRLSSNLLPTKQKQQHNNNNKKSENISNPFKSPSNKSTNPNQNRNHNDKISKHHHHNRDHDRNKMHPYKRPDNHNNRNKGRR